MPSPILHDQAKAFSRKIPSIEPGYTVRVHERIQEAGKERIQAFEGMVISVHRGHVATDATFTVRKVVSGIGVERVFPMLSHVIDKIEVKKIAKVRRAKLYFLRGRSGKSARMNERFTNEGEFVYKDETPAAPVMEEKAPEAIEPEVMKEAQELAKDVPENAAPAVEGEEKAA